MSLTVISMQAISGSTTSNQSFDIPEVPGPDCVAQSASICHVSLSRVRG